MLGPRQSVRFGVFHALILLLAVTVVVPGNAQTSDELESIREERREAQQEAAEQAKQVDAANVEVDELTEALAALQVEVNTAQDRVDNAQRNLDDAEQRLADAEQAVDDKQAEIEDLKDQLADRAISSFINQGNEASLLVESDDPNQAVRMQTLVENVTQGEAEVTEQLRAAEEDLRVQEGLATDAATEAEGHRDEREAELVILNSARDDQAALTVEAEARLDHELSELAAIRDFDSELAAEEQAEIDRLAEELAAKTPPPPSGGGGGQPTSPVGADEIVTVQGIQVHSSIADNVDRMLTAAANDGIDLSGGGYRSSDGQIAVRRNNCGTSHYDIYEKPASHCRPPTARPGTSQHEKGLAIDFTYNGSLIRSRNNAGYRWLAANAAAYGFKNLPSEPWHWSTTGR